MVRNPSASAVIRQGRRTLRPAVLFTIGRPAG
jgi:hypothetical protein